MRPAENPSASARLGLTSKVATRQSIFLCDNQALFDNNLDIAEHRRDRHHRPSGAVNPPISGFTTGFINSTATSGPPGVLLDAPISSTPLYIMELRRKIGMIFQKAHPLSHERLR